MSVRPYSGFKLCGCYECSGRRGGAPRHGCRKEDRMFWQRRGGSAKTREESVNLYLNLQQLKVQHGESIRIRTTAPDCSSSPHGLLQHLDRAHQVPLSSCCLSSRAVDTMLAPLPEVIPCDSSAHVAMLSLILQPRNNRAAGSALLPLHGRWARPDPAAPTMPTITIHCTWCLCVWLIHTLALGQRRKQTDPKLAAAAFMS